MDYSSVPSSPCSTKLNTIGFTTYCLKFDKTTIVISSASIASETHQKTNIVSSRSSKCIVKREAAMMNFNISLCKFNVKPSNVNTFHLKSMLSDINGQNLESRVQA